MTGVARHLAGFAAASVVLSIAAALASCIIADPPVELPHVPLRRPTIVHDAVQPTASRPLGELPPEFDVPIELTDPSQGCQWRTFVDYDPGISETASARTSGFCAAGAGTPDIQTVHFSIAQARLGLGCHRIDFIVALTFDHGDRGADAVGADSITWFYSPTGDLSACTVYDGGAGIDGAFPADTGVDGAPE